MPKQELHQNLHTGFQNGQPSSTVTFNQNHELQGAEENKPIICCCNRSKKVDNINENNFSSHCTYSEHKQNRPVQNEHPQSAYGSLAKRQWRHVAQVLDKLCAICFFVMNSLAIGLLFPRPA